MSAESNAILDDARSEAASVGVAVAQLPETPKRRTPTPVGHQAQLGQRIVLRRLFSCLLALAMCVACIRAGHHDAFMELHPLPMIVSFVAVMPEVLHMSNNVRRARSMADRYESTQMHLRWALCLKSFAVIGFALAYISKMHRKKTHFKGLHSIVGAICIAALSLQVIAGLVFHFRIASPNMTSLLRKVHYWLGLLVVFLGCSSISLGFTTHYGERAAGFQLVQVIFYLSAVAACSWAYLRE
jgi:hypothetical protein